MIHDSFLRQPQELNMHTLFGVIASGKLGITEFESMYESFNPLTTVNKQHFVEWFSGSALDSIWTKTDVVGTGTFAMDDAVDGGFKITTGATIGNSSAIGFNGKNQYAHDGSVIIFVSKRTEDVDNNMYCGMGDEPTTAPADTLSDYTMMEHREAYTNIQHKTSNNSSATRTAGSVARSTSWINTKIELNGSNSIMYIDGVYDATITTNLPSTNISPVFNQQTVGSVAVSGSLRYCEVYNT